MLEVLLAADGGYVSAEELLDEVWDEPGERTRGVVKIVVHTLRRKLGRARRHRVGPGPRISDGVGMTTAASTRDGCGSASAPGSR